MSNENKNSDIAAKLQLVKDAIIKSGYDPVTQLSGYILSEDPTYIPDTDGARSIIRKLDRDDILAEMIKNYLD
ncbi:MAG: IreB family regulatory phosphoprotein [Clostridia bacterium]|nr:IreB family regulatory phosphoprotein [Clostridia bacterium]